MEKPILEIVTTLANAVELIMSPTASAVDRVSAHQICEEFKESSPHIVQCGLAMAQTDNSPVVRHFGLQLLEHCIKYRWQNCSQAEKATLRTKSYMLLTEGIRPLLVEEGHIKDGVARVIVEIIKHEWPNNWPTLVTDLCAVCEQGATQTELVMKVLLRLAEDVIIFQNMQAKRRREIQTALISKMGQIFNLFVKQLQAHTSLAKVMSESEEDRQTALVHTRVSEAVLVALSGYLDWVNVSHLIYRDSVLLQLLCLLLHNEALQLSCAECLLIIASRKGKVEERKPLLILFSEDALSTILNAAVNRVINDFHDLRRIKADRKRLVIQQQNSKSLIAERGSSDEHFYLFLKRLCQVVTELGKMLAVLWGAVEGVGQPQNFHQYLDALLAFTKHPSQMLSNLAQAIWNLFLRQEHICKDPIFQEFIPKIILATAHKLQKVGYPSQNNSLSCAYTKLDFDNDMEFNAFFSKFRTEGMETIRLMTLLDPQQVFKFAADWVMETVNKPIDTGGEVDGMCKRWSPAYLEWDSLSVYLDSMMTRIQQSASPLPDMQDGVRLLQAIINFNTKDPLVLTCQLPCISALFIYIKCAVDAFPAVLQKIFSCVVFEMADQTKGMRSKTVKNVRQHACSCLVRICKQHPDLFFPVFEQLYNHIRVIESDQQQLTQMERCILYESLILVSNEYRNFEKQSQFLEEVFKPVREIWLSQEFTNAVTSPDKFMAFIGLDQAPVEPSSADTCGINRFNITYCVQMMLGGLKRSRCPEDAQMARDGGFQIGTKENGDPILRHPSMTHVTALLPNLLSMLRMESMLWTEECIKLRHADFAVAMDLMESEKLNVLGIQPPITDKTTSPDHKSPCNRMQHFLAASHDLSCHILGNAGHSLGHEFYANQQLPESMIRDVLSNLDNIPDYRLRPILRVFLKPYVQHCPKDFHTTAVLPILAYVGPVMHHRLVTKWEEMNRKWLTRSGKEEPDSDMDPMCQEALDEQLVRLITRDYFEFIVMVCRLKDQSYDAMDDMADTPTDTPHENIIGELFRLCLIHQDVYPSLVMVVANGITWNDTVCTNKCIFLFIPLLKQLLADNRLTAQDGALAAHLYSCILVGLQVHGQCDTTQALLIGLGVQAYELLRPHFQEVYNVMLKIPQCMETTLKSFDEKIKFKQGQAKIGEKKKKELYKKMVFEIIGKNLGAQFRREVQYKSLPPLFQSQRRPRPQPLEESNSDIGLCNLFEPEKVDSIDT